MTASPSSSRINYYYQRRNQNSTTTWRCYALQVEWTDRRLCSRQFNSISEAQILRLYLSVFRKTYDELFYFYLYATSQVDYSAWRILQELRINLGRKSVYSAENQRKSLEHGSSNHVGKVLNWFQWVLTKLLYVSVIYARNHGKKLRNFPARILLACSSDSSWFSAG